MYHKNHSIVLIIVPSYFKLKPDKEEKITDTQLFQKIYFLYYYYFVWINIYLNKTLLNN